MIALALLGRLRRPVPASLSLVTGLLGAGCVNTHNLTNPAGPGFEGH